MRKLFLDDVRSAPWGWALAKDYTEFVQLVDNFTYDLISFDHDLAPEHYPNAAFAGLGESNNSTGLDCARYVIETGKVPTYVIVHSMNPVGSTRIIQEFAGTTTTVFREVYRLDHSRIATLLESEIKQDTNLFKT